MPTSLSIGLFEDSLTGFRAGFNGVHKVESLDGMSTYVISALQLLHMNLGFACECQAVISGSARDGRRKRKVLLLTTVIEYLQYDKMLQSW